MIVASDSMSITTASGDCTGLVVLSLQHRRNYHGVKLTFHLEPMLGDLNAVRSLLIEQLGTHRFQSALGAFDRG